MRYVRLGAIMVLAIGSLAGCDEAPEAQPEKSFIETTAPLVTGFTLHNLQTGYCLGTAAGASSPGTGFIVWTCDGSANQVFNSRQVLPYMPVPYCELVNNVAVDRCMYGNILLQCVSYDFNYDYQSDAFKSAYAGPDSNGHDCYTFENEYAAGQVIGVSGGSTTKGASVILWHNYNDRVHHPDQMWCVY